MALAQGLGIIAGGGSGPRALIAACRAQERPFCVIALKDHADPELPCDMRLGLGEMGALQKACARYGLSEIVLLGRVHRPSLLDVKPDLLGLKVLAKIGLNALGDDGLLKAVCKAIEEECNVRVVGAHEILSDFLTPMGLLTTRAPDELDRQDIARGWDIAGALGSLDVGQAALVQHGVVLGVEAIEGTDALIARARALKRSGGGGVLVKRAKPQQDRRFDLPSCGKDTLEALAQAGFAGLALEAGKSLFFEREEALAVAKAHNLFVLGLE